MMQAGSCYSWGKGMSGDKVTLNCEEIKPVSSAIIKLCLSEEIISVSKLVDLSVSQ